MNFKDRLLTLCMWMLFAFIAALSFCLHDSFCYFLVGIIGIMSLLLTFGE